MKNTRILSESLFEQQFHTIIGEVCNIGEEDLRGSGLVSQISIYQKGDLLDSVLAIPGPSETLLRGKECISFKWPIREAYNYDKISGNSYFMHGLCGEENVLC